MIKKWVLVTGADSGIGKTSAEYLAAKGFGVYAGCLDIAAFEIFRQRENIVPLNLNVTDEKQISDSCNAVVNRKTGLFAVVNNAGIALAGSAMELDTDDFRKQFEVNLFGVHTVTRTFFPLIQQAKGKIVMIGSGAGLTANPFFAPYSSSKFALEGYTDAIRRELQFLGIQVIMIEPGLVKTPIWDKGEQLLRCQNGKLLKKEIDAFGSLAVRTAGNKGLDPLKISERIHKVMIMKHPKARYFITPDRLQNWIINRMPSVLLDKLLAGLIRKEKAKKQADRQ